MIQLDLFGEPIEKKMEEQPTAKAVRPVDKAIEKVEENKTAFIFSDDKIGVKIKQKAKAPLQLIEEAETVALPQNIKETIIEIPITIIEIPNDEVEKEILLKNDEAVLTELLANTTIPTDTPLAPIEEIVVINPIKEEKELPKKTAKPDAAELNKRGRKSFKDIDAEVHYVEVPNEETLFQKQYYNISTVADWFHVNTSLIRYWENEFDILKPRKNRKGDRLFRPEDVKNLQVIYYLLRQRKFSIEGAKQYLKDNKKTIDTNMQVMQTLQQFKSFLLELKANIQS